MPLVRSRRYTIAFPPSGDRATGHSPADATSYFFGWFGEINPATSSVTSPYTVMQPGTLIGARIRTVVLGTLGSAEAATFYARINNTTDVTLSSAVKFDAASQSYTVTGLSQALADGDTVEIKFTAPTWTTNPTAVVYLVSLLVQEPA